MSDTFESCNHATVKLWHPKGCNVFIPLPVDGSLLTAEHVNGLLKSIDALLAGGFTVNPAGTEPGEQVEEIGWLVRMEASDGTPHIGLYSSHEAMIYRLMGIYLNTDDDIAAFEAACGVKLNALKLYDGDLPPKRDDAKKAQYFHALTPPVKIVVKDNPAYDPDAEKKKSKRLFVRWYTLPAQPEPEPPQAPAQQQTTGPRVGGGKQPVVALDKNAWGELVNKYGFPARAINLPFDVASMGQVAGDYEAVDSYLKRAAENKVNVAVSRMVPLVQANGHVKETVQGIRRWQAMVKDDMGAEITVEFYPEAFKEMAASEVTFTGVADWMGQLGEFKIHPPLACTVVPAFSGRNYRPYLFEGGDYEVEKLPVEFEETA